MVVRCIENDLSSLNDLEVHARLSDYIHLDGPDRDLRTNDRYHVQALEFRGKGWWLYLHSIEGHEYPFPYPMEFFLVEDNTLPSDWCIKIVVEKGGALIKRISFKAWVEDDYFYEKLIEGDCNAQSLYMHHFLS